MQPRKRLRSSGISSNMERSSDSEVTAEPPRKPNRGKGGDKQRQEEKRKRKADEKPAARKETVPPLPLDKVEGQNPPTMQERNKPQADPKSAVPTKFGSRRSKRAAVARGGTSPTHLQFPGIVKELRAQKFSKKVIDNIVGKLESTKNFNTEELLLARTTALGYEALLGQFTRLGQDEEDAMCLAAAILKLRQPTEPEPRLSPRDAGLTVSVSGTAEEDLLGAAATLFANLDVELTPGGFIDVDPLAVRMIFDIEAPDNQSLLYRRCYEDIYDIVFQKTKQVDATGTPGIGKSTMLFFFVLFFLKAGRTVVLATRKTAPGYLVFRPEGTTSSVEFAHYRPEDSSFVFLLDVPNPSERGALYPGLAIWVHSPGAERQGKEYLKRTHATLYLPLWSEEEVTAVWNTMAQKNLRDRPANENDLIDNQAMWGNVPRAIFVPRTTASRKMAAVLAKLRAMKPDDRLQIIANVGGTGSAPELIDSLLLIEVVTTGEWAYLRMQRNCRAYVYKAVLDMHERDHRAAGLDLAAQFSRIPELGGPYGTLFELHAHDHIALGWSESYTLHPIHREPFVDGTACVLTLQPTRRATFRKLQELMPGADGQLKIEENVYYQPTIKNLAAGDGFILTRNGDRYTVLILQYTVAARHDIVAHGVTQILETLGAVGADKTKTTIKFVFVVPEHVLTGFRMGRVTTATDTDMQNYPESVKRTELYKMKLDYPRPAYEEQPVSEPAAAAGVSEAKESEVYV